YNGYCHSVSWIDYDNDGWLDVFFTDIFRTRFNQLYRNNQDGTFTQVSNSALSLEASSSIGATWADVDLDGDMDVFIPNNNDENNSLYRNDGGTFVAITTGVIVSDGGASVGSAWGDFDNDGDFDLYVVNASQQANALYENQGNWTFSKLNLTGPTTDLDNSHGCHWMDLNNDGNLDLFVANDQAEENRLYMNNGDGTFWDLELDFMEETENSLAVIANDLDEDGDLDIFVANHSSEANSLYKNSRGACANWVSVCLTGTNSNSSGIGARIQVKSDLGWQTRFIDGGSRIQSGAKAHFGLGVDASIDSIVVSWPSGIEQVMTNQAINQEVCITENAGTPITGLVYFDEDEDCVWDSLTEVVLPNVMIEIQPGPRYAVTDSNGQFTTYLNDGEYGVEVQVEGDWTATCSDSNSVTISTGQTPPEQRFGLTTPCTGPDLVVGGASSAMRKGSSHIYTLTYQNDGVGTASSTQLDLRFPPEIIPVSFSQPQDYSVTDSEGTVYTWLIGSMAPRSAFTIQIVDSISNDTEIDDELSYETSISSSTADCDSTNNSYRETGTVEGSFDPNDILVFPEGAITTSDTLIYRIRFQNVGNSEAQLVTVHDTLPAELDLTTFKLLSTSHPATLDISEEGSFRWTFRNINLPDSISDEPNSHGFIQFRIRPKKGLTIGTEIHNRAAIVFDQNEPIITNTVVNVIADALQLAKDDRLEVKAYPNPMVNEGTIILQDKTNSDILVEIQSVTLLSPNGGVVWQADQLNQRKVKLPRGRLSSGLYLVEITDAFGFRYRTKLILK
ncbi:MAG: FG-GAP-like repeat-containing protein, partial [Bacteroidota bacterium]